MQDIRDRCILVIDDSIAVPVERLRQTLGPALDLDVIRTLDAVDFSSVLLVLVAQRDSAATLQQLSQRAPAVAVALLPADDNELARGLPSLLAHAQAQRAERNRLLNLNRELADALKVLRDDEEAGRRVQQRILPASPMRYGALVAEHRVVPSLYLSGDFIDHFELVPGYVGFYLADVSGHGMSSAFVTLLIKTLGNRARRTLRRELLDEGVIRPSRLAELVNQELLALAMGKHVTLFAGVIDAQRRELRWSVAGHYPQALVFDGKCAHYLEGKGMPAGLFDEAVYEDRMHPLPEGFALVLCSDGLMELMSETSLADKEARLLQAVSSGAVTVEALSREFSLDGRREVPDDIALLVIRDTSGDPA